jgi:uncharacterized protein YjaG (DUF416 family)
MSEVGRLAVVAKHLPEPIEVPPEPRLVASSTLMSIAGKKDHSWPPRRNVSERRSRNHRDDPAPLSARGPDERNFAAQLHEPGVEVEHQAQPMTNQWDQTLEALKSRLARLDRRRVAIFFAACGERLFPLYESFAEEACGSSRFLRDTLDGVWRYLDGGGPVSDPGRLVEELELVAPHADDFEGLGAAFAQDAVICVDIALRALSGEEYQTGGVEYAIEPVRVAACLEETGFSALGTSRDAERLEAIVLRNDKLQAELRFLDELIASLDGEEASGVADLVEIQKLARDTQWTKHALLSGLETSSR